ncbi:hypothetical protein Acsp03_35460 [Actinomadura sp. NBRC 104412]|uniref:DUF2620 family protein n=1 Tax=Actinomadura sp. NBRC 104412 TaxID=3032203 RepID=UPI0024A4E63F|nr:DUF2620 family protein [Actinomadura sp. NBRC 104412]GLZ06080.1 hypothetical protein Acsp03_35460 [Actinomadura sp. NBRC 104412]
MTKILVGGVGKVDVAKRLEELGGFEVVVTTDMDAATRLMTGQADYYIGTCHTGAGGSLGVLVGLLGAAKCHTFGRGQATAADAETAVADGKIAFGCSIDQVDQVVPVLAGAIRRRHGG